MNTLPHSDSSKQHYGCNLSFGERHMKDSVHTCETETNKQIDLGVSRARPEVKRMSDTAAKDTSTSFLLNS